MKLARLPKPKRFIASATMTEVTSVTSIAGETVDLICRRRYGDESGYVEAVYDANRGIAKYGPILPAGVVIVLPEVDAITQADTAFRLWD